MSSEDQTPQRRKLNDKSTPERPAKRPRRDAEQEAKRLQREEEREAKRKQREEQEEAKRKLREEQEEAKRKAREEKEAARRKAQQEKDETKRKAQEERERIRQERLMKKEAEEEQKKAAAEEREKKRQERERAIAEKEQLRQEKLLKEQAEKSKLARQSQVFRSFFHKVEIVKPKTMDWGNEKFRPFEIKGSMILAPRLRRNPLTTEEHDALLRNSVENSDFLSKLKRSQRKSSATIRRPKVKAHLRAKLFQFHDNYRPPYYGTWRRKSKLITGRCPMKKSPEEVAYDVDSEAEWEEEQQAEADAEDCFSDPEERERNLKEEVEVDNEFYVRHGYLSDGEGDDQQKENEKSAGRRASEFDRRQADKERRKKAKQLCANIVGLSWKPKTKLKNMFRVVVFDYSQLKARPLPVRGQRAM